MLPSSVLLLLFAAPRAGRERAPIVASVAPAGGAEKAGIRAGDALLSARRGRWSVRVRSCAELLRAETEEAPIGAVTLRVRRGGETLDVRLPDDPWLVTFEGDEDRACGSYARGRTQVDHREWAEAHAAFREAAL
ncbi:MAG TPA: PDZ domain-containing protein, partial [Thermoanaerobaculia bacterium]|nr:PDZ domain-containing protein [Thermoanaerobaculia bacterium]